MADFTKLVRSLTSATREKPSRLNNSVGAPFWIGTGVSLVVALYLLSAFFGKGSTWMITSLSIPAAFLGGVVVQALFDLRQGIKGGEVRKRYLAALSCILLCAAIYGVIYYHAPDNGLERAFLTSTLVIFSASFGYIMGRAKG